MWRQGRGKASGQMWTGSSSFKLRDPNCPDAVGEGVGHLEKEKNSEKSQEFLDMVVLEGQGPKRSHVEYGRGPRLCALGLSDRAISVGGSEIPGGGLKVGDSWDLLAEKGVETCTSRCRKATVSEEFPSCCPRSVALKCWSLELRKLQKRLEDVDEGRGSLEPEGVGTVCNSEHDALSNFRVPPQVCGLEPCESIAQDDSEQFELYGVDWPMHADVSKAIDCLARQHHELRVLLEGLEEGEEVTTSRCDQLYWDALKGLERHGKELREVEGSLLKTACPTVLRSLSVAEEVNPEEFEDPMQKGPSEPALTDESDPPPLQTKIIGADQVRREPDKWIPSMTEEYHSLVSRTGAVQELSDGQYQQLLGDPGVTLEVISGKLVYVHKTSGRRKSRIVGCGNYCQGGSGERNELYASGAGAESLRLMIRRCALQPEWVLGSVDVRTAFLQAPLLEQQRDGRRLVTIVRVPSILRETGVTTCRFWKVQKALYGLASAPRSWSNYRDKVLAELRIPCEGGELRLSKMLEDANLLHIVRFPSESGSEDSNEGQRVGVIALYVDDVLIGAARPICEAVIKALQDQWELSPPEWLATTGDQMKFAGYELQKTSEGIRLHQESYVQDLLEQNEELIAGEERAPAVKMGVFEDTTDDAERRELTKRSQGLIGQLLWLAGRTRPDLAYAVSMAAQKTASSPREAVARAEHLVRYLRGAPGVSLHYKIADGNCGKWGQLRHQQTSTTLDVYTDASFAADEQCRSFGSVHLYWGGALVSWASARQTLIAAHTAESELYSLAEGHLMGKAFRPTVAALMNVSEHSLACHLYCDNAAAVQLCTLESGSWRTRHLRLRGGAIIRQDLERDVWALAHLEGVYMPADLGTKPVGPARLEDLLKVCDLWTPHLDVNKEPPRPGLGPSPGASSQNSKYPVGSCELGPSSSSASSGKHSKTPVEPCELGPSSSSASSGKHSKTPVEPCELGPSSSSASAGKHSKTPVEPCELGPSSSSASSGKHSKTPVEPCELGPSSSSASAGEHSRSPVGACGLGSHPGSKSLAEQPRRPVELWGLGQDPPKAEKPVSRLDVSMRADEGLIGERRFQIGFRDSGSGFPVDRFPRPRGTKQSIILSCKPDAAPPLVYLTQNGGCVHSGCECQPMRCSGAPIVRSLCRFCLEPGVLPYSVESTPE